MSDPGATVRGHRLAIDPRQIKHMFECRAGRVAHLVLQIVQAFDRTDVRLSAPALPPGRTLWQKGSAMAIAAPFPAAQRLASTRQTHGDLRLTARGRMVLGVTSIVFLLLVVMFSGRLTADAGTSLAERGRATGVVVVQPGENLWQIARSIAPQSDPRETVIAIRELNGLGDSTVKAGQSIVVPVHGAAGA